MTETRIERIIKDLAGLSAEELDIITNKVSEKRQELREEKVQQFLDRMKNLITEARENNIYFYCCDEELWEHNISIQ